MQAHARLWMAIVWLVAAPAAAYAQASITGVVRDTSGAVLPGVTVEAASPALIEKVRTALTDGTGQYRVENLRPGIYIVTYTLPGFSTVKREGVELTGTFAATLNAEMRLGTLEETVTVTGDTPTVDVQSTTRQRVMDREILDAVPRGGSVYNVGVLVPGVVASGAQDVGGAGTQGPNISLRVHGSKTEDAGVSISGVSVAVLGSSAATGIIRMDQAATQEVVVDTAAVDAEMALGGVRLNQIPRDGGNTFNGLFLAGFANHSMQGSNFSQELQDRGLRTPSSIDKTWDLNPGFGGPLKRDRLWFYGSARHAGASQFVAGMFENRNLNNPNAWTFDPDPAKPVTDVQRQPTAQVRFTWQATAKNKVALIWHEADHSYCPQATATASVERAVCRSYPLMRMIQGDWTSPMTSRVLFEFGALVIPYLSYDLAWSGLEPGLIGVTEQSTGLGYRSGDPYRRRRERVSHYRAVMSYVTGAHAFKIGLNHRSGFSTFQAFDNNPLTYRFNNGVPNQLTQRAYPWSTAADLDHDMGIFAQDKWTIRGLTLGYGLRYDYAANSFPEQHVGPAILAPGRNITFPAQKNLSFQDVTPKLGAAYDPFGTGKTAFKVSLNKYLMALGPENFGGLSNPVSNLVTETTRTWTDGNRDFVADCDLTNPRANGECGAMANANFGGPSPAATFDYELLHGWNKRNYNWEFAVGVQQELLPRIAADLSYFRRWYGNFPVADDRAVAAADFDPFQITAPSDPRLPGGGGYTIAGLYDLNPSKFGVPADYFVTLDNHYGKQVEYWHGVDATVNARPRPGLLLQGGLSTGRTVTDNCGIVKNVPEASILSVVGGSAGGGLRAAANAPSTTYCHVATAFLTQMKFLGSYTVPRWDVQVSGAFQSLPGPEIAATYNAPNADIVPSLGRNLAGGARNATLNLVRPGTMYGERMNQLDLRVAKIVRLGRTRTSLNVDLFNALNSAAVLTQNNSFGAWQQPTSILLARFVKLSAQINF